MGTNLKRIPLPKQKHVGHPLKPRIQKKRDQVAQACSVNGENAETASVTALATDEETSTIAGKIGEANVEKIKTTPGLKNDQASGLFLTNNTMLTTLQTIIGNGYQFDRSAVKALSRQ